MIFGHFYFVTQFGEVPKFQSASPSGRRDDGGEVCVDLQSSVLAAVDVDGRVVYASRRLWFSATICGVFPITFIAHYNAQQQYYLKKGCAGQNHGDNMSSVQD